MEATTGTRIINLNIRSARNKVNEIGLLLHTLYYPEIVCLTESWLRPDEEENLKIDGYKIASSYCRIVSKGGGVLMLVKDNIKFTKKPVNNSKDKLFEVASIVLYIKKSVFHVSCIYRSPGSSSVLFAQSLEIFLSSNKNIHFICGDFNYNFLGNSEEMQNITEIFASYGFTQTFSSPSRIQNGSVSLIDNIFTNTSNNLLKCMTLNNALSDHFIQLLIFKEELKTESTMRKNKRIYSRENKNAFKHFLGRESWEDVYNENNIESKFTKFFETLMSIFNMAFPVTEMKDKTKKNTNAWITRELIEEGQFLRDLHLLYTQSKDPNFKIRYNILKKRHEKNIKCAKIRYNSIKIQESTNMAQTAWNIIGSNLNMNNKNNYSESQKFVCEGNKQIQANMFNKHFIDSVKKLTNLFLPNKNDISNLSNRSSMFLFPLLPAEVRTIILESSKKKSSGSDEFPCTLLKVVVDELVYPIMYLINISFHYGYFPDFLKKADIIPIHKKGDWNDLGNYRPVALLSAFSKVFEKAYKNRLTSYLNKFKIISNRQFGFVEGRSTQDAILSLYQHILQIFEQKKKALGIFFDMSKAFDTINHVALINKLYKIGVRGNALRWVETYLSNRTQRVRLLENGKRIYSSKVNIKTGVPQGSVLGPLLFILYINDVPDVLGSAFVSLFADDASAIMAAEDISGISRDANRCVSRMREWCDSSGLVLNAEKTNLVLFSPVRTMNELSILVRDNDKSLSQSSSTKFLGLELDSSLTWELQIGGLVKRLASRNYCILQLRQSVNSETLKMYYYGCVNSLLSYGILCWGNSSKVERVFLMQKRILRGMLSLPFRVSCRPFFREHRILTVYCIYILEAVTYVHKYIDKYQRCGDVNVYRTRISKKLYVPQFRLTQTKKGPDITFIKMYNCLPQEFKNIVSVIKFKKKVRQFLAEKCFYSHIEYFEYCM